MIFFKKKLDRLVNADEIEKKFQEDIKETEFEKGDIPALFIAAFLTFLPILLVLIGVMVLLYFLF